MVLPNHETDYIQGYLAESGKPYEIDLLKEMTSKLQPDDLVIDVGANIGNHSLYLACIAKCKVIAFEPNTSLCEAFQQTIELNGLESRITLYPMAVGEEPARAHFKETIPNNLGAQSLIVEDSPVSDIEMITLDCLNLFDKVRAIKIDVEGMELSVVLGATKLIKRDQPLLFIEANSLESFNRLESFLKEYGYLHWGAFNATPTHFFIHANEVDIDAIGLNFSSKAREIYALQSEKQSLQDKLTSANSKYRDATERIDVLKQKLQQAYADNKELHNQINLIEATRNQVADKSEASSISNPKVQSKSEMLSLEFSFSLDENFDG